MMQKRAAGGGGGVLNNDKYKLLVITFLIKCENEKKLLVYQKKLCYTFSYVFLPQVLILVYFFALRFITGIGASECITLYCMGKLSGSEKIFHLTCLFNYTDHLLTALFLIQHVYIEIVLHTSGKIYRSL